MFGKLLKTRAGVMDPLIPPKISIYDWAKMFQPGATVNFNGSTYQAFKTAYSGGAGAYYDNNSVVFSVTTNRCLLFSEARFMWQQLRNGRPGDLFGNQDLASLEEPWLGATTRDLLAIAELDVACYGNSYWIRDEQNPRYFLRWEPENVTVITERATDEVYGATVGERLLGYGYKAARDRVVYYDASRVAHYKPHPSTRNRFIGQSWLAACMTDVESDEAISTHMQTALNRGGSIPYVVSFPPGAATPAQFEAFVEAFRATHEGTDNSGKTLFLNNGADIKTIGQTFQDLAVKAVQGGGETRVAAAAGIPPVIVGLSEGLAAATYSNYGQARRRLVDGTMRPLWGAFAGAFESLMPNPGAARLWYDDRDIPFLREDIQDQATVKETDARTIKSLIDAGFEPDSVIAAVNAGDMTLLKHSGLYSVQLQTPGSTRMPTVPAGEEVPVSNSSKPGPNLKPAAPALPPGNN